MYMNTNTVDSSFKLANFKHFFVEKNMILFISGVLHRPEQPADLCEIACHRRWANGQKVAETARFHSPHSPCCWYCRIGCRVRQTRTRRFRRCSVGWRRFEWVLRECGGIIRRMKSLFAKDEFFKRRKLAFWDKVWNQLSTVFDFKIFRPPTGYRCTEEGKQTGALKWWLGCRRAFQRWHDRYELEVARRLVAGWVARVMR